MVIALVVALVIAGVVGVLLLFVVGIYNGLVRKRGRVDNSWSQIDVQLQRRYDLIPNLVETVKGYAKHESGTLEAVIAARAAGINAQNVQEQAQAENILTGALKSMFAVSEAYPELKANQNFIELQEELTATEDKIGYSRQFYNDSVLAFNNALQAFPANLIAGPFGFASRQYFEADATSRAAVKVQF